MRKGDIRQVDLNLLVALDALLDARSVTRAAARLSLTQPTVSGMLARLRDTFGDPLFVRAQRGIVPTPRAEALAGPLKRWLADADALLRPAGFDPRNAQATFAISLNDHFQVVLAVPLIRALRREAPGIRLAVTPMRADVTDLLARGDLDLAVTLPEHIPPEMRSVALYRERYVGAVRPGHPVTGRPVTVRDFCRFDHVVVSPTDGSFEGPTDRALAAAGRRRTVSLSVPSFLLLPEVLHASDLIAVVPEQLLRAHATDLVTFEPPVDLDPISVAAGWHPRVDADPAHRWIRERLRDVARGLVAVEGA